MVASLSLPHGVPSPPSDVDQRVILYGVDWRSYSVLRELLDSPAVRMTYLEGALEIMSPSPLHEAVKKRIARLLELYALEREIPLNGYGSTTLRREIKARGLEPDECYVLGRELDAYPDLAIEVVLTSGGLDKLAVYSGLGVREVWMWIDGEIRAFTLEGDTYVGRDRSALLPEVDLHQIAELARIPDQLTALRAYRSTLRGE
jgi:Uma2 family endonuclease